MVSRDRKKKQKCKQWNEENREAANKKAHSQYMENKDSVKERAGNRMLTDQTLRKHNTERVKARLLTDTRYKVTNTVRAARNRHIKRNHPETRAEHLAKHRQWMASKLKMDEKYHELHLAKLKENEKNRLQDKIYRERHQAQLRQNAQKRMQDDEYRERRQAQLRQNAQKRMQDDEYRERRQAQLRQNAQKRMQNDEYRERRQAQLRQNAQKRMQNEEYREEHKAKMKAMYQKNVSYHNKTNRRAKKRYEQVQRSRVNQQLADRQKYWIRRSRLLAVSRRRAQLLEMRKKMETQSGESMFNIQLLFNKAEYQTKVATAKVRQLHAKLCEKVQDCLHHIPTHNHPTESDIVTAFEELRNHTTASEPYFWEQSSRPLSVKTAIPVDETGQAHTYKVINTAQLTEKNSKSLTWECNSEVCSITEDQLNGSVRLLRSLVNVKPANITDFYINLDRCRYETRSDCFGHSIHCSPESGCMSLLRPARSLSCHFPHLRSIIRRIYEIRRLSLCIQAVNGVMSSGDYSLLQAAIEQLHNTVSQIVGTGTSTNDDSELQQQIVSEEEILQKYGEALKEVAKGRDTYNTDTCDVCEQLRKDLRIIISCQNLKGFNSQKMQDIIDLLYQNKTQHEDIYEFLETLKICKYCVDKLRSNKAVNRSCFNRLSVIPTPDCIKNLNLFERTLIKFCMPCVTIVRLGQVSNKARPRNELTAALKGRIAYLPVDVAANAKFLPENLLNVDSLVLLVGGQPTQNNKIWTSLVDLNKVHEALRWLRLHNRLYKDIPQYTIQELQKIMEDRTNLTQNTSEDNALIKKLDDASKSYLYENFTIQPLNTSVPADVVVDYQLNKVSGESMNIFDTDLDVKAFPELFPTGENGIKDTMRECKISTSDFIRSRLLNKDPKFRLNINYLFHCFQVQEVSNMCHSIGHMLRSVTGNKLSAKAFYERLEQKDGEINSNMFSLMANIRGSKEYFAKLGMDIKWMIKRLGPPTLFITCSTAEWFSDALTDYLKTVNKDIPNIGKMTPAELCCMDPVSVSLHFQQKWNAIFTKLINNKQNPVFGEVADHFWRIEYQARGAPHVHCILWIKDAPVLGRNTVEEVKEYINKICTSSMPDADTSPTIHHLVQQFQVHKCNKYCTKTYKRQGVFYKKCRFGFPRPVRAELEMNSVIDCLAISRSKQPRKRLYNLPRTVSAQYVNDYNPALLMANQANIDVQYIGHVGSRLPYYITDYITKQEKSEQDTMWQDIFSSTRSLGSNAMSYMLKAVKSRQVGANEAADRLLGHKLHSKSRQLRFADLAPPDKVKRVLKPAAEIKSIVEKNPDAENIFQPHWVQDVYPDRPDKLETCSLYEFLGWYEKEFSSKKNDTQFKLKTLPYSVRRRKNKAYIVTHQTINLNQSEENRQMYFYYLLKLFKPWRMEADLCISGKSYEETYEAEKVILPEMQAYHEMNAETTRREDEMEKAVTERAQNLREAEQEGTAAEDPESAFVGCRTDHLQTAMQDIIDINARSAKKDAANQESLSTAYTELNIDQRRIVDTVVSAVCDRHETLLLFVSGQGGTGKSRVIDVLNRTVCQKMTGDAVPVVVAAPTGLAAFSIGGTTVHRMLSLPVEHGKPANYSPLQQEQLTLLKATLKGLKLIIIDEVSMISSLTLLFIHMRLTEILCCEELFGGVSIVFFGDLFQLPPVKGNQPFIPVSFLEAKQRFGAIASIDVWNKFTYDELTINMRQSGDKDYADLLTDLRLGKLSDDHHTTLQGRLINPDGRASVAEICDTYTRLVGEGHCPLILMPKTCLCDEINSAMLNRIGTPIQILSAIDTLDTIVDKKLAKKVQQAYAKSDKDVTRTAGLEKELRLCVGCKIMLKKNKSVDRGLVNGSVGQITGFNTCTQQNKTTVQSISVKFDKLDNTVNIERESASFEVLKSVFYTRKQFPLMLSFAITTHKSQGLSLSKAIVDAGSTNFGPGMVYVALSRVTSLTGLHLIDLDRTKITCDKKAVDEYNRLRQLHTPHLGNIDGSACSTKVQHNNRPKRQRKTPDTENPCKKFSQIQKTDDHHPQPDTATAAIKWQKQKPRKEQKQPARGRKPSTKRTETKTTTTATVSSGKANEVAVSDINQMEQATSHQELVPVINVFKHCSVDSIDEAFQAATCQRLNLPHSPDVGRRPTRTCHMVPAAAEIHDFIYHKTQTETTVTIRKVSGAGGNCLFRAFSLALTGRQDHHDLMRSYIVNHMLDTDIEDQLRQLYHGTQEEYSRHLVDMQNSGTWGTDQEIASAAHLFNCAVLCFSVYNDRGQHCIQAITPHFATERFCSSSCKHQSIYLVNETGQHYDLAVVSSRETEE